jgi:hypothetical protein
MDFTVLAKVNDTNFKFDDSNPARSVEAEFSQIHYKNDEVSRIKHIPREQKTLSPLR